MAGEEKTYYLCDLSDCITITIYIMVSSHRGEFKFQAIEIRRLKTSNKKDILVVFYFNCQPKKSNHM